MMNRIYLLLALSLLLCACEEKIKEEPIPPPKFGNLEGVVHNEYGQAIDSVLISLESQTTYSGATGFYSFKNLEAKEYEVSASKDFFLTEVESVEIIEDQTASLDFTLPAGEPYLFISDSIRDINANNQSFSIQISSNSDWTVECNSAWLTCPVEAGNGNEIVHINCMQNEIESRRTDTIVFASGPIERRLIVSQADPLLLVDFEGIIGNGQLGIVDSVSILFNKPIQVEKIVSLTSNCTDELNYDYRENKHGFTFTFDCARMGKDYSFIIGVRDSDGNTYSETLKIPFYKSRIEIDGWITDYVFLNNDEEVLVSTWSPHRLVRYSIPLDSVIRTYDLSAHIFPRRISYNPYNSQVYIMGSNTSDNFVWSSLITLPDVYTLELNSGQIEKAFTVPPDEDDHPEYPVIYPYGLEFTNTGEGIILLASTGSSAKRWKLVDSSNGHSISKYAYFNTEVPENIDFIQVHRNYDQTKLMLMQYVNCSYGVFERIAEPLTMVTPSLTTQSNFIKPSRRKDLIYVGQLYDQFIMDLDGNISRTSILDTRGDSSADFCYNRDNDWTIFYYDDDGLLKVLDYNIGQTISSCDMMFKFLDLNTTRDGNYAVGYENDHVEIESRLYIFNTDIFLRHLE
jgi:hypothetical protein